MRSADCLDDAAMFGCVQLLVGWRIPKRSKSIGEVIQLAHDLPTFGLDAPTSVCAATWLVCKYGTEADVGAIAVSNRAKWRSSEWASRQIAAATPRMLEKDARMTETIIGRYGLLDGGAVL